MKPFAKVSPFNFQQRPVVALDVVIGMLWNPNAAYDMEHQFFEFLALRYSFGVKIARRHNSIEPQEPIN